MRKSRRLFIRNTSLAALGMVFVSATKKKTSYRASEAISCSPEAIESITGTITSVRSGNWSDKTTWGGVVPDANDTAFIASGHIVTLDTNVVVAGLNVSSGGTLQFSAAKSTTLQSNKNVVIEGLLKMRPSSAKVVQTLQFINVAESKFVGSTMDPVASDVGLWVMGAGKMDVSGTAKKSWTNATDSVKKGATSFTVKDATGWQVGDEVMIAPMEQPNFNPTDWDDNTATLIDYFLVKFECRIITAISGNKVSFKDALQYDHTAVVSNIDSSLGNSYRKWTPEVANLSRNVKIQGTKGSTDAYASFKRAHIFIRSTAAQSIRYMEGKYLGPRKYQDASRPTLVTGRYGLHFHHCEDGSRGSVVEGCVMAHIGTRCYVPHVSHGIKMRNNVAFDALEEAFWYDFQDISHDCIWDKNLMAAIRLNGVSLSSTGMMLGQGDGNKARNNVAVYANGGELHNNGGCYKWEADAEGVWVFENNIAHSCTSGIFVWQNTSNNHTIIDYDSFYCHEGITHGAYSNSYTYRGGHHYKSLLFDEATSSNTSGVVFQDLYMDAGGANHCAEVIDSPIPSNINSTNKFINCVFRNFKISAVQLASVMMDSNAEKQYKIIDIICCDYASGQPYFFDNGSLYPLKSQSQIRVQPIKGQCFQTIGSNSKQRSDINVFAPKVYGTGMGLMGSYYNGTAFNNFAFKRLDSMIMFQQWSYDKAASPTGVHYKITGDQYSIRWAGQVEAQYSESYTFYLQGSGGHRMWLNGKLIIDSWTDRVDNAEMVLSKPILLTQKNKYDVVIEHYNSGGSRGCTLLWKCPSLPVISIIPQCQLYNGSSTTARTAPLAVSAGDDITLTLPLNNTYVKATVSNDADDAAIAYQWVKISGPASYTIVDPDKSSTNIKGLIEGEYVFRVQVTDSNGNTAQDNVKIIVENDEAQESSNERNLSITAAPNPTLNSFKIQVKSNDPSPINLTIYNKWGVQVFARRGLTSPATVTVGDNFKRGSYYGVVEQGNEKQSIKLLKL
ncbi:hypothetical protein FC093_21115 [Ilyomonas limi]|uniref:T9SS type A sorting domain-containing protein n=1 Tax=Ilyomonas limi TaxID=2575867 RepID=A0A4U3KVF5_9BACT|nr:PA14 domain-containing protein [Ilyomonas limi]TKK65006.1 hypothetical protein FC093_21115 [Ilyomonas limi]